MKKFFTSTIVFCLFLSSSLMAQDCGTIYGAGYNGSGSSIGIQSYNFATNTFNGSSLVSTGLFVAPNTMNNGGPIAIDPLNQNINFLTDALNPRRVALFTFGSTSLNIVDFPASLDALLNEQVFCSGYKHQSHECYYMTGSFLSTYPSPTGTGFFSIDFSSTSTPTYKFYSATLAPGSPFVNINGGNGNAGADLCFDANDVGYLVTGSKQLYRIALDQPNNTAVFSYLANLNTLSFIPTAIAFNPANNRLIITGATETVAEYNLSNNVVTNLSTTAGYQAPDLASCFFPDLNPTLNIAKTYYDVTQAKAPPTVVVMTGDTIRYTITITNTGNVNAAGLVLEDPIPNRTSYVPGSTTLNGMSVSDIAGGFPYASKNPAASNDQGSANGILSTSLTAGSPSCTITYLVKVTGVYSVVDNIATATVSGPTVNTPIIATTNVSFVINGLLPLTLLDFSASKIKSSVQLDWKTTNELNLNRFEVEASADAMHFHTIGSIIADSRNAGTSVHHYHFEDAHPLTGENYYRLKQIDNDQHFTYSSVKYILFELLNSQIFSLSPNPTTNAFVNILMHEQYKHLDIQIINTTGQVVFQNNFKNNQQQLHLNLQHLASGTYFVSTRVDNQNFQVSKLIVQ